MFKKNIVENGLYFVLMVFVFMCKSTFIEAAETIEKVSRYYGVELDGVLADGRKFSIGIQMDEYDCTSYTRTEGVTYWGTDGTCPLSIIKEIHFVLDGESINFPVQSYLDLANLHIPTGVYVKLKGKAVRIYLKGGDGAGSYKAVFEVLKNKLLSRLIIFRNKEGELETRLQPY